VFVQASPSARRSRAMEYDPETALMRLRRHNGHGSFVVGQLGQSLDGRIATPTGASKYINGAEALRHLHRIRSEVDAVIVGVGTAIADDPQLTTRHVEGPNPVRVVIDPNGRLPAAAAMLHDGAAPVLVVTCPGRAVALGAEALEIFCDGSGNILPGAIVDALAARGLRRLLIEGGAETLARFLNAAAIDELHLMVAPIVLGSGKTGLNLAPISELDEAIRPIVRTMRFRDGDMLCMCDMQMSDAACPDRARPRTRSGEETMAADPRYPPIHRLIHWTVAVIALCLLAVGMTLGILRFDGVKETFGMEVTNLLYKYHKTFGVILLGLMTLRIVLRLALGAPDYDPPLPPFNKAASAAVHGLLYVALLVQPLLGWAATAAGGYPIEFFQSTLPGFLTKDPDLSKTLYSVHYAVGLSILALLALHVGAALMHWLVLRDNVMRRMSLF